MELSFLTAISQQHTSGQQLHWWTFASLMAWTIFAGSDMDGGTIDPQLVKIRPLELLHVAFMIVTLMAIVILFRLLSPWFMRRCAPQVSADKHGKCQVYITELFFTTLALSYVIYGGGWSPTWVFDFSDSQPTFPHKITSSSLAAAWTCAAMYMVELSGEPHMRPSLLAHHFAFCTRVVAALLEMSFTPELYVITGARMLATWLWLPLTEQNVFVVMLAYRIWPNLHPMWLKSSAILYVATRVFGILISLGSFAFYIKVGFSVVDATSEKTVFAFCICTQLAGFGVMAWAQWSSAKSQWGLAVKQASKLNFAVAKDDESVSSTDGQ
mmetsp:Transcript_3273/g.6297  ORF Transcript_3273/g.6297 Transcript_3273/m.6297 type:complete len:326 (+) Transcript_3273:13-990(+)